jgi:hypothetical protein
VYSMVVKLGGTVVRVVVGIKSKATELDTPEASPPLLN